MITRHLHWIRLIVSFTLLATLLGISLLVYDGTTDDLQPVDVGVVFGNTVTPGGQPSARLRARLDRAIVLYQERLVS
jgi:hypothetical protein